MHRALPTQNKLRQLLQVSEIVLLTEETRLPVVPPLHDVLENTRDIQPWLPWHERLLAESALL
ncbi:hypothetical protein [Dyella sp.]|jgi:hypothetical protein|uniref:hypothetical protein n=1 Tax=Dyella sp. TaxID=1869338 RepID=UPI002D7941FD|nr:hypothetical protein [Dyella sp.]HET6431253.1 hypothetical protein [Dyella sp.]